MWIEQEIESLKLLHHNVNTMIKHQRNQNIDNIHMDQVHQFMRNQETNPYQSTIVEDIDTEMQQQEEQQQQQQEEEKKEIDIDNNELRQKMKSITSDRWDESKNDKDTSPPLDYQGVVDNILGVDDKSVTNSAFDRGSDTNSINSDDSDGPQRLVVDDDKSQAYKSLSKMSNETATTTSPVMVEVKGNDEDNGVLIKFGNDDENKKNKKIDDKLIKFAMIEVGVLSKSVGGKSLGDSLLLKDIISQFQTVIKQHARVKLIKSYASKKIKVNEFKTSQEIYGLIELIISCVIKLKYKDNVQFNKNKRKLELSSFIEWIVNDKDTMNGKSWSVDKFADVFDQWICKIIEQ